MRSGLPHSLHGTSLSGYRSRQDWQNCGGCSQSFLTRMVLPQSPHELSRHSASLIALHGLQYFGGLSQSRRARIALLQRSQRSSYHSASLIALQGLQYFGA